jgi:hypothetical protein
MTTKRPWILLAVAPVAIAFLAAPHASIAKSKNHVTCQFTHKGKTETKKVASAKECAEMGGVVVSTKEDTKKY